MAGAREFFSGRVPGERAHETVVHSLTENSFFPREIINADLQMLGAAGDTFSGGIDGDRQQVSSRRRLDGKCFGSRRKIKHRQGVVGGQLSYGQPRAIRRPGERGHRVIRHGKGFRLRRFFRGHGEPKKNLLLESADRQRGRSAIIRPPGHAADGLTGVHVKLGHAFARLEIPDPDIAFRIAGGQQLPGVVPGDGLDDSVRPAQPKLRHEAARLPDGHLPVGAAGGEPHAVRARRQREHPAGVGAHAQTLLVQSAGKIEPLPTA